MEFVTEKTGEHRTYGWNGHKLIVERKELRSVVMLDEILGKIDIPRLALLLKSYKLRIYLLSAHDGELSSPGYFQWEYMRDINEQDLKGRDYWIKKTDAEKLLPVDKTDEGDRKLSNALSLVLEWIDKEKIEPSNVTRKRVMEIMGEAGFGCYESPIFKFVWKEIPEMKKNRGGAPINNPK